MLTDLEPGLKIRLWYSVNVELELNDSKKWVFKLDPSKPIDEGGQHTFEWILYCARLSGIGFFFTDS